MAAGATHLVIHGLSFRGCKCVQPPGLEALPRGPTVVPFWGSYIGSYKVMPKRNYYGASVGFEGKG